MKTNQTTREPSEIIHLGIAEVLAEFSRRYAPAVVTPPLPSSVFHPCKSVAQNRR